MRHASLAPGFKASQDDQNTVQEIARRLFTEENAPGIFLESENNFGETLANRLPPDVKFEPAAPDIGFVHRKTDSGDIYFLANTGNTTKNVKATFRGQGMQPEQWDPMTGQAASMKLAKQDNNGSTIDLALEPYASQIIVFTKRTVSNIQPVAQIAAPLQTIDLSGAWTVSFGKDSKPVMMDKLGSWTENEATRYFSGVAVYEKKFAAPAAMLKDGLSVQVVLGDIKTKAPAAGAESQAPADINEPKPEASSIAAITAPTRPGPRMQAIYDAPVREAAVVYINGKRAGSLWCPPYSLDVTGLLKSGENNIRIEVANLAVNYMADFKNHPLPDYKALIARFGDRFQPQDMNKIEPVAAGLLGPIRIISGKKSTQ